MDFRSRPKDDNAKSILLSMSLLTLDVKLLRYTKLFTFLLCSHWIKMLSTDGVRTFDLLKFICIPHFMQACFSS